MKTGKTILRVFIGILVAAGLTVGVSFANPGRVPGTLPLTARGVGAGVSVLIWVGFAEGWIAAAGKRMREVSAGTAVNGYGFGLLPGMAVWKGFEGGTGFVLPEGWPGIPWVTEGGLFLPSRAEMILLPVAFGFLTLWVALRRKPMPGNGDLLPVAGTLSATVILLTRGFAGEGPWLIAGTAVMAACLAFWATRIFRRKENTGYALASVLVWVAMTAIVALQHFGVLVVNTAADFAIRSFCVLIAMKAVLCAGRIGRRGD